MSSAFEHIRDAACEGVLAVNTLETSPQLLAYFRAKEKAVRPVGILMFALTLPLLLVLMLLVKVTSSGPAIYRQRRVGKNGQEFVLFKLRTMYNEAEKLTGPIWSQPQDSRVTPVGRFLRLLHLDELPQLWNVVRGEMDLVGPRPERPEIVQELVQQIPGYLDRIRVLPGITGLAQVNQGPDQSYECVRRKLVLDREYIDTASLWLDVRMIACTAFRIIGMRHGRAVRWLGLERRTTPNAAPNTDRADCSDAATSVPQRLPGEHAKAGAPVDGAGARRIGSGTQSNTFSGSDAVTTLLRRSQARVESPRHAANEPARPNKPK